VVILASKPGQLGNMLMLFSNLIARSIESGFTVANPAFNDYAEYFAATRQDVFCRYPPQISIVRPLRILRGLLYHLSNLIVRVLGHVPWKFSRCRDLTLRDWTTQYDLGKPEFLSIIRSKQLLFLRGWLFRDSESMKRHADKIREFFRPVETHARRAEDLIRQAHADADILIGVHIRHGYLYFAKHRQYFYATVRYAAMMDKLCRLFTGTRVAFLVCSDWAQDPDIFRRFNVTWGTNHLIEDMYAFAGCDYLVGPPSTFTIWASFYGNVPLNLILHPDQNLSLADFTIYA